jgi:hypothetical protein
MRTASARLVIALALSGFAIPALSADAAAQTFSIGLGNSFYSNLHHCPTPPGTLTTYRVTAETDLFGLSGTFNDEDYPWPPEDGGISSAQQEALLNHGPALEFAVEVYPLGFTPGRLKNYIKPFVGVGLHTTSDGDVAAGSGQTVDTYGVRGSTDALFTAGAKFTLPLGGRFGVRAEGRLTGILSGEYQQETPAGALITVEDAVQTWGEWSLGFTFRVR